MIWVLCTPRASTLAPGVQCESSPTTFLQCHVPDCVLYSSNRDKTQCRFCIASYPWAQRALDGLTPRTGVRWHGQSWGAGSQTGQRTYSLLSWLYPPITQPHHWISKLTSQDRSWGNIDKTPQDSQQWSCLSRLGIKPPTLVSRVQSSTWTSTRCLHTIIANSESACKLYKYELMQEHTAP